MDRYQRKQEENQVTRMEMIKELENHGILISRKANTVRVTKKYLQFKEEMKKKKEKTVVKIYRSGQLSRHQKQQVEKKKQLAIALVGRNTVPRYRAVSKR